MAGTIVDKLRIKKGVTLRTLGAPDNFQQHLQPLPADVKIVTAGSADQLHWFVLNRKQLEAELPAVIKLITGEMLCWVYYPKGSSKIQTDLTRDRGWDSLLAHTEFNWVSLISFDDTWSTFGFRLKTEADKAKEARPQVRAIFDLIDPVAKTIRLPADLEAALKGQSQARVFETLSFSNRKEYVEWVITAKREETRKERIAATLEKLAKGWKNPRNI